MLTPLLQICPILERRRKLLRPYGCAVPVNSTSVGFTLTPAGLSLYTATSSLADLDIPTTPGKLLAVDAAHPPRYHFCVVTDSCSTGTLSEHHICVDIGTVPRCAGDYLLECALETSELGPHVGDLATRPFQVVPGPPPPAKKPPPPPAKKPPPPPPPRPATPAT